MQMDINLLSEDDFFAVDSFDCGVENEPLTEYIKDKAFKENRSGKSKTYLVKNLENNDIIGYFSLRTSGLGFVDETTKAVNFIPAVELSEFALDNNYQVKGIGSALFQGYIVPKVQELAKDFGCQIILVYAFHEKAIKFYKKNNFIELKGVTEFLSIVDDFSVDCDVFIYTLQPDCFESL